MQIEEKHGKKHPETVIETIFLHNSIVKLGVICHEKLNFKHTPENLHPCKCFCFQNQEQNGKTSFVHCRSVAALTVTVRVEYNVGGSRLPFIFLSKIMWKTVNHSCFIPAFLNNSLMFLPIVLSDCSKTLHFRTWPLNVITSTYRSLRKSATKMHVSIFKAAVQARLVAFDPGVKLNVDQWQTLAKLSINS